MKRIQLQLVDKNLEDVVREMTDAVMQSMEISPMEREGWAHTVRLSIHSVLEKYVHAYDLCGLTTKCQEAVEMDPWKIHDQDQD